MTEDEIDLIRFRFWALDIAEKLHSKRQDPKVENLINDANKIHAFLLKDNKPQIVDIKKKNQK